MRAIGSFVAAAAVIVSLPVVAVAQDDVAGISISSHATFDCVGVNVVIAGDDNENAVAAMSVEVNGGGAVPGHRLSRAAQDRFVGSALFLPPGAQYVVTVTLEDPDGVSDGTLVATGETRPEDVPTADGESIHVSAGAASGGDGSSGAPFASVAAGIAAAGPGDEVVIHAGTYREEVTISSGGTEDAVLVVRAAGDGEVIMSGAHEDLLSPTAWTDEGDGIWSAQVAATRLVVVDDVRLWRYESLDELEALSEGTDGGFFFDGDRVFVRLPGDAAPDGHVIEVSVLGRAFWLEGASDVVIRGLTVRCYGGEEYSEGIMVRDGSHRVWIVDNTFEHVMPGVWVKNDVDDLAVMENEFSDRGLAEFPWYAVKAQGGLESGALAVDDAYDGRGIVFKHNYVHDSFDGLGICGDEPMSHPNDADVFGNTFFHLGDDGIEVDGDCSNIRVLLNRFEEALVGVSTAPAATGPAFVVRNLMVDLKNVCPDSDWMTRAIKLNVGDPRPSGEVFVYHNTAGTFEEGQPAFGVTDDSVWERVTLANNIWMGADHALYYQNSGDEPFLEDGDLLCSASDRLVYFQGSHYDTLEEYQTATGLCAACLAGDLALEDPQGGDWTPSASSPAIDGALPLAGINDEFTGEAPDIGAIELGGLGPDVDADADSDSDTDGDADGDGAHADGDTLAPEGSSCACDAARETTRSRWPRALALLVSTGS